MFWHLNHLRYRAEARLVDETMVLYPFGRMYWNVSDRQCGSFGDGILKDLTLTDCSEDEFTCDDGTCQPLKHRCDLKGDCADRSDEVNCTKVVMPEDYEKDLAPKHTRNGERVLDPLPVYLGVDILSFDTVDTVEMMIGVIFKLNVTWKERRVDYLNLRDDFYQNLIPDSEKSLMWIPEIGFYNAKTGPLEKDDHDALMVRKERPPKPFDNSRAREDYVYEGYENSLIYNRRFYAEYHCLFHLENFPFDVQVCEMIFKMRTATKKFVELRDGGLKYKGEKNLIEFNVANYTMINGSTSSTRSEMSIQIVFSRNYVYHLGQSYMQSLLLGVLAYCTFWIDISDFIDRFMGSLTCLLVLASLMSSVTQSLPKTSYYKVSVMILMSFCLSFTFGYIFQIIDFWLLYFLLSTSLNIAMHIMIDRIYQREKLLQATVDQLMRLKKPASKSPEKRAKQKTNPGKTYGSMTEQLFLEASKSDSEDKIRRRRETRFAKTTSITPKRISAYHGQDGADIKAKEGVKNIKLCGWFSGPWTAERLNDFQKALFPLLFLVFLIIYSTAAYQGVPDPAKVKSMETDG